MMTENKHAQSWVARAVKVLSDKFLLTNREEAVICHVVEGLSNKQIATRLNISTATIRAHLNHICRKMTLRSRGEIAYLVFCTSLANAPPTS